MQFATTFSLSESPTLDGGYDEGGSGEGGGSDYSGELSEVQAIRATVAAVAMANLEMDCAIKGQTTPSLPPPETLPSQSNELIEGAAVSGREQVKGTRPPGMNSRGMPRQEPPPPGPMGSHGGSHASLMRRERAKRQRHLKSLARAVNGATYSEEMHGFAKLSSAGDAQQANARAAALQKLHDKYNFLTFRGMADEERQAALLAVASGQRYLWDVDLRLLTRELQEEGLITH